MWRTTNCKMARDLQSFIMRLEGMLRESQHRNERWFVRYTEQYFIRKSTFIPPQIEWSTCRARKENLKGKMGRTTTCRTVREVQLLLSKLEGMLRESQHRNERCLSGTHNITLYASLCSSHLNLNGSRAGEGRKI